MVNEKWPTGKVLPCWYCESAARSQVRVAKHRLLLRFVWSDSPVSVSVSVSVCVRVRVRVCDNCACGTAATRLSLNHKTLRAFNVRQTRRKSMILRKLCVHWLGLVHYQLRIRQNSLTQHGRVAWSRESSAWGSTRFTTLPTSSVSYQAAT